MRPTIKNIANLAGVTHATVSMVLNNRPGPSEAMREKILKIVEEVGYVPDINARNLAMGKNNTLGIFILNFPKDKKERMFYYYMDFLEEVMIETKKRGYTLLIFTDQDETRDEISYADICIEQKLRVALFLGLHKEDKNLEALEKLKATKVILFDLMETKNFNTITSESYMGIKEMFDYLGKKEIKKLAVIKGRETAEISTIKKKNEIDMFAKNMGIAVEYFKGNFLYNDGYKVGKNLIVNDFDCLFAMNDAMAIGAIDALRERGFSVPEDIKVVGFDNLAIMDIIKPRIPSIAHDTHELIESIFKIIENSKGTQQITIPTQFIEKED